MGAGVVLSGIDIEQPVNFNSEAGLFFHFPEGRFLDFLASEPVYAEYMAKTAGTLQKRVYPVPTEIDAEIAELKLSAMKIGIDVLTPEQEKYLASWEMGT